MNPMELMQMYSQLKSNPMQLLASRFNLPQDLNMNDPNAIIQHLLNSGQISQQQVDAAMGMRNNPMFSQFMGRR